MDNTRRSRLKEFLSDFARSDQLPMLSGILAPTFKQLGLGLGVRCRVVLDTSTVIADLFWLVARRQNADAQTALAEAIAARVIVACAPPQIDDEVRGNLAELEEQTGVSQQTIWSHWLNYRRLLTFVEPDQVETRATEYLRGRDPSDIVFVQAAESFSAEALLTSDPDLLDAEPRAMRAREIVIDLRNYAREKSAELTVYVFGAISFQVSGQALAGALRALPRLGGHLLRLPGWLKLALIGGVIWLLASSGRRARASQLLRDLRSMFGTLLDSFMEEVETLVKAAAESHKRAELARARVAARVRPKKLLLRQAVRLTCAEAGRPLSVREIENGVRDLGYVTTAKDLGRWVLRTLRADSRFIQVDGGWRIRAAA